MLLYNAVKTVNVTRATIIQRCEVLNLLFLAKPLGIAEKWPSKWEICNCIPYSSRYRTYFTSVLRVFSPSVWWVFDVHSK